jgi:hypothetical protein
MGENFRHELKKTINRVVLRLVEGRVVREIMLSRSVGRGGIERIDIFHIVMRDNVLGRHSRDYAGPIKVRTLWERRKKL